MAKPDIQAEVKAINLTLKADCHRVSIQVRGRRLSLVSTLPPKPGSNKRKPHQQRISLKLGATLAGIRRAKAQAILLSDQLDRGKFTWEDWGQDTTKTTREVNSCGYWLDRFKAEVWKNLPEDKEFNWRKRYLYFGLNKLPTDKPLTPEAIVLAVLTKPEDRKAARDKACTRLQRFANFAGVDVDLSKYKAGYSRSDIKPRDIPTDKEIETLIDNVQDAGWKHVFALMATYGLRDHEAFLCTLESRNGALVANIPKNTKTGTRTAYPYPKHWVERWSLAAGQPPELKAHQAYGQKTAEHWRDRLKYPGTPYNLRHAYAIRCHHAGVAIGTASQWMGHSPKTHLDRYQRWISETVSRQAWEKL
ncbi:site-specific integrase [Leptothoe kymatousa]|uniref:Tyr recombinase domain-containing protein n=1 Tax=Leptothoe kymatousa TAU-MAC 1615 TaxID=2364775 RepID=A0ABS5Y430_9CYAN|nr:hypothetical protein [Leptothoe kymatousa]MBT9312566.1 hypothetical protein [Leptothoe kymatousa TAU-MAC 1615]